MVLRLSISAEAEARLKAKAAVAGVEVATFASRTLERFATRPSLEDVLRPLRDEFDKSGMTEDELTEMLEQANHETRNLPESVSGVRPPPQPSP